MIWRDGLILTVTVPIPSQVVAELVRRTLEPTMGSWAMVPFAAVFLTVGVGLIYATNAAICWIERLADNST